MIVKLDYKNKETAEQIVMLQRASYKLEADLIGFDRIPPLLESVEDITDCSEIFYGYFTGSSLAGLTSYKLDGDTLDIHRVAVHPDFLRQGIAKKLIGFLEQNSEASKIIVSTGLKNTPAVTLYKTMGFCEVSRQEIEEGLSIVSFEKTR